MPPHIPNRFDPNAALDALQGNLARLVDQYRPVQPLLRGKPSPHDPPIDLVELPGAFVLLIDLPGVDPATIDLTLDGPKLTIQGERPLVEPTAPGELDPKERRSGPFRREMAIEGDIDVESVRATLRDGVLRVDLPRLGPSRTRSIPVQPS